ncbi:MAG: hypothetical protein F4060_14875 [Holophagales bacterium]|nr:hypothetical protein [Holophagales bacterium]MYG29215.1 hypothetical protein [Holophagales bacterium]MYI81215.1 hypothetical protein [Holophagales bacterium]
MKIPAHTLYVVLCYAWERYDEHLDSAAAREHASVPDDLPQNLLARLLRDSFRRLWRRGLDRGYLERAEDARRPKGKIDMARTVARALRSRARVAVRYEELTRNVLPNRLVKSTMLRLASLPANDLDHGLRHDLLRLARLLPEVDEVELRGEFFHGVQLHRNNSDYGFLLSVCRLVAGRLVPEGRYGRYRFRGFAASDTEMGNLFEAFVRGFLKRERPELGVWPRNRQISFGTVAPIAAPAVPAMFADIFVPSRRASERSRSVIVETKCVNEPFAREGKLRSDHLYQLWAYLTNYSRTNPTGRSPAGMLLYATDGHSFRHAYGFPGHPIEVRSLDLGQAWPDLRRDLHDLANDMAELGGASASAA